MPVILQPEVYQQWLNTDIQDADQLDTILREGHFREFKRYPVSRFVNSTKHNDPRCIEPARDAQ
jgi:putative SOS response-associated peptidase YedK